MDREYIISEALRALEQGRFQSIQATAVAYNLDHTLLIRRRKGQRSRREARVNQQNLSPAQEELLVR